MANTPTNHAPSPVVIKDNAPTAAAHGASAWGTSQPPLGAGRVTPAFAEGRFPAA